MNNFEDYYLKIEYQKFKPKNKLEEIDKIIDWESLRPVLKDLYNNDTEKGGRPNIDEIVMIKSLFLQAIYNISDEALESELHDRLSFMNFLNYPEIIPDAKTIWHFRELLSKTGKDKTILKAISKLLEIKGVKIKNGMIQDATFITSDPGYGNYKKDKGDPMKYLDQESVTQAAENEDGKKEDETKNKGRGTDAKTRRSRDGTWAKKNDKL
ncbi:MAG: transposase [Candidatus Parvarchaeota archaeon]